MNATNVHGGKVAAVVAVVVVTGLVSSLVAVVHIVEHVRYGHRVEPRYLGWARLMDAVEAGRIDAVRRELARGTDPNLKPPADWWEQDVTPLATSASSGRTDIVEVLLASGADPNICDGWYYDPLAAAAAGGHIETMRTLLHHGAQIVDGDGNSDALWCAAMECRSQSVAFLLARGANARMSDPDAGTLLSAVESKGYTDIAAMLRRAGAR